MLCNSDDYVYPVYSVVHYLVYLYISVLLLFFMCYIPKITLVTVERGLGSSQRGIRALVKLSYGM